MLEMVLEEALVRFSLTCISLHHILKPAFGGGGGDTVVVTCTEALAIRLDRNK